MNVDTASPLGTARPAGRTTWCWWQADEHRQGRRLGSVDSPQRSPDIARVTCARRQYDLDSGGYHVRERVTRLQAPCL